MLRKCSALEYQRMIEGVARRSFGSSSGTYNVQALELAAARERKLKGLGITVK